MSATLVDKYKHYILAIWALLVVAYLRYKAPILWQAEWSHDDLMNCYRAMNSSWLDIARQIIFFWEPSPLFRPLGELFYKVFWEQFGFSPLPWRLACGALMILNAFIIGHIARLLTGSLSVGLAATAVASFHSNWVHLYINTGTIFELLAFTFVYAGLAYYIEFREPWFATLLLILGLNSKESAVVLPVLIVVYEWIWNRKTPWLFCGLAGVVCTAFIVGRVYGEGGLSSIGGYAPHYSFGTYWTNLQRFLGELMLWKRAPVLLLLLPLLLRNRLATFAVILFPVAVLPLAFVPERTLEGVYIACAALAFALPATLLLFEKEEHRLAGAMALFVAVALWMPNLRSMEGFDKEFLEIREFREGLTSSLPQVPARAQIRFISEPFSSDYPWASTFITRLVYKNPDIVVVSGRDSTAAAKALEVQDYASFEWKDGKLSRIR